MFRWANRLIDWLVPRVNLVVGSGIELIRSGNATTIVSKPPSTFPWHEVAFGAVPSAGSPGHITVYAGLLFLQNELDWVLGASVSETEVEVTGGTASAPHYVYVRYPLGDFDAAEIPATALATVPSPNETYWQTPARGRVQGR